jgi:hypothetical protein
MALPRKPQRRTTRNPHLDASIVHVERALLARAEALEQSTSRRNALMQEEIMANGPQLESVFEHRIAEEFRLLAEELHYW